MQIAQGWDWGTVPAWFSAILSGGSVLLALYIILRDRKKAERADAAKIVCWLDDKTVHVLNTSDRAVHSVYLMAVKEKIKPGPNSFALLEPVLRPGVEINRSTEHPFDDPYGNSDWEKRDLAPYAIMFHDADGVTWIRELHMWRPLLIRADGHGFPGRSWWSDRRRLREQQAPVRYLTRR